MGSSGIESGTTERLKQRVDRRLLRLANLLTLSRLLATPIVIWALLQTPVEPSYDWIALGLICVLQMTDVIDGRLARKAQGFQALRANPFGEVLDPIADKLYINSAYITLMVVGRVPVWAGGLIVARDAGILLGWSARFVFSHIRLLPNKLGKATDSAQAILLVLVLLSPPAVLLEAAIYVVAGLTVASGASYFHKALDAPREA